MARLNLSREDTRLFELNGKKYGTDPDTVIGPAYPEMGAGVAKFRRLAEKAGSISAMSKAERFAYGSAVENAIKAKHRSALLGASVVLEGPCRDIGDKIRGEHKAALSRCMSAERKARSPSLWGSMYAAAMAEKRSAVAPERLAA